jgi:hypothetical protein
MEKRKRGRREGGKERNEEGSEETAHGAKAELGPRALWPILEVPGCMVPSQKQGRRGDPGVLHKPGVALDR